MTEKETAMREWADALQDGANELLELALDMLEGKQPGYEWPQMLGMFIDQMANLVRTGDCAPAFLDRQRTHMAVAIKAVQRGFSRKNASDVKIFDQAVAMMGTFNEILDSMPGYAEIMSAIPKDIPTEKEPRHVVGEVRQTEFDVLVVLPKGTPQAKFDRVHNKIKELAEADQVCSCLVTEGVDESTRVSVRVGDVTKYSDVVEEVLHGHLPVPKKNLPPVDDQPAT